MNSTELRRKQADLIAALEPLANKKAAEFTDEDRNLWTEKSKELKGVTNELRTTLEQEELLRMKAGMSGTFISADDKKTFERYSFRKAMLAAATGRNLEGVEAEMHEEAIREARAENRTITGVGVPFVLLTNRNFSHKRTATSTGQNVAVPGDGGYFVQQEQILYYDALRDKLLLPGMGARLLTGLVGDLPLVEGGVFTASWLTEVDTDTTTKAAFDQLIMKPNRLQATGALSIQLLRQASLDVERMVEDQLISAHALGLQKAAINGSGSAPEPRGILNKSGIGSIVGDTSGKAPTWANIIGLETEVAIDNADGNSMAYLTNARVRGKLKQTPKETGYPTYVWDANGMNGYPAFVTNAVPHDLVKGNSSVCSAIIFGDFSKLIIGQWGNLDIIVDPYSLKKKAEVETTVISYGDIGILQPGAFAAMKDALTA